MHRTILTGSSLSSVAVIGAGVAGCVVASAAKLAGIHVTLFDKSSDIGGRMSTRKLRSKNPDGTTTPLGEVDHGAQSILMTYSNSSSIDHEHDHAAFEAAMHNAERAGALARWEPVVSHSVIDRDSSHAHREVELKHALPSWVPTPNSRALCKHLLGNVGAGEDEDGNVKSELKLQHTISKLRREPDGWHVDIAEGGSSGPFDSLILACPPLQAAALLETDVHTRTQPKHASFAQYLRNIPMVSCWAFMGVSSIPPSLSESNFDIIYPPLSPSGSVESFPLQWLSRNDRRPGRESSDKSGLVTWLAHASPTWSEQNLEADAAEVEEVLHTAVQSLLPPSVAHEIQWHRTAAHRWRYSTRAHENVLKNEHEQMQQQHLLWNADDKVGVCGDGFGDGFGDYGIRSAWLSGNAMAKELLKLK